MKWIKKLLARIGAFLKQAEKSVTPMSNAMQQDLANISQETHKPADPAGKPWNFSEPKPKAVKKAKGKVVPLTPEQIIARSRAGNRKPNRAQRRAASKVMKDAA